MNRITESYAVHAEMKPDQIAIIDEQESITYQDWYERVQRSAQWLQGTVHQQKESLFIIKWCFFLQIFAGAAYSGWTAVPLDPRWSHEECVEKLLLSEADLAIIEDRLIKRFEQEAWTCRFFLYLNGRKE